MCYKNKEILKSGAIAYKDNYYGIDYIIVSCNTDAKAKVWRVFFNKIRGDGWRDTFLIYESIPLSLAVIKACNFMNKFLMVKDVNCWLGCYLKYMILVIPTKETVEVYFEEKIAFLDWNFIYTTIPSKDKKDKSEALATLRDNPERCFNRIVRFPNEGQSIAQVIEQVSPVIDKWRSDRNDTTWNDIINSNEGIKIKKDKKFQSNRILPKFAEHVCNVMEYGANKYKEGGWLEYNDVNELLQAIGRHWYCLNSGKELDSESNLPHTAHIAASCMMLQTLLELGKVDLKQSLGNIHDNIKPTDK